MKCYVFIPADLEAAKVELVDVVARD